MIRQLQFVLHLTISERRLLLNKRPWNGKQWDDEDIATIKTNIRAQLEANQTRCAYCGLPFKGKKDKQIEHIAPKAKYRQPQFTFTLLNLVLSCVYCNTLLVKGTKETVVLPANRLYKKCNFLIVHPYFDDPNAHFQWTEDDDQILVQVRNNSDKGRASIKMFDLDSEGMSEMRATKSNIEKIKLAMPINEGDEKLVEDSLEHK